MQPKSPNDNSAYKNKMKLDLGKLKNGQTQNVKVGLTKVNIITLTSQIGVLSEDVKLYMKLVTSKRYYDLNDRTINLLKKGDVDMSATTSERGFSEAELMGEGELGFSDAQLSRNINKETQVEVFITERNNTRAGGSFFPYLKITIFDVYLNMAFLK